MDQYTDFVFASSRPFLFLLIFAVIGLFVGFIAGPVKEKGSRWTRGLEIMILTILGGVLARLFVGLILGLGDFTPRAGFVAGWAFNMWAGGIDLFVRLFRDPWLTEPRTLLSLVTIVGALVGFWDGLWRIHKWDGAGILTFLIDVTWGLGGSTSGVLLHLVNFLWADHTDETRLGAHIYDSGFRFKSGFAVTQGSVMSNMHGNDHTSDLFDHENTHVLQNRIFGPFFILTYLGWMVVWVLPALVVGLLNSHGVGDTIEKWCYFNNPWEGWAYKVGCGPRSKFGGAVWSDTAVIVWAVIFFLGVIWGSWHVIGTTF